MNTREAIEARLSTFNHRIEASGYKVELNRRNGYYCLDLCFDLVFPDGERTTTCERILEGGLKLREALIYVEGLIEGASAGSAALAQTMGRLYRESADRHLETLKDVCEDLDHEIAEAEGRWAGIASSRLAATKANVERVMEGLKRAS